MAFNHYSVEKRKKIALYCAIGFGIILILVLVVIYMNADMKDSKDLSTMITSGYTTLIESTQSYFTKK